MEDRIDNFFDYAHVYVKKHFASTIPIELEEAWRTVLEGSDETALSELSDDTIMGDLCDFYGDFSQREDEEDLVRIINSYKYQLPTIH